MTWPGTLKTEHSSSLELWQALPLLTHSPRGGSSISPTPASLKLTNRVPLLERLFSAWQTWVHNPISATKLTGWHLANQSLSAWLFSQGIMAVNISNCIGRKMEYECKKHFNVLPKLNGGDGGLWWDVKAFWQLIGKKAILPYPTSRQRYIWLALI